MLAVMAVSALTDISERAGRWVVACSSSSSSVVDHSSSIPDFGNVFPVCGGLS